MDVRAGVSRMMAGDGGPPAAAAIVVHTSADDLLSTLQRNHVGPSLPPAAVSRSPHGVAPEVTTLQVGQDPFFFCFYKVTHILINKLHMVIVQRDAEYCVAIAANAMIAQQHGL